MIPMPFAAKVTALSYGYGLSSHFVHVDFESIGLVWDRASRDENERKLLHDAHISRIFSDMVTMALARAWILNKNGNGNTNEYEKIVILFNGLIKKIHE